jgi:glycosyltransferase involved in cell wall biosynthesis
MSNNPAISVILPVFNGEAYLREAIDSILNQSFRDFELLIINDGSTDCSQEIINSYQDARIELIHNPINLGLVGALNAGIDKARGKYLARQDQDDISEPNRLQLQFARMEQGHIDLCGTRWSTMQPDGKIISDAQIPFSEDTIFACLATTVPFAHGSVMMRKSFMSKHHLQYDKTYLAEDYCLWIRFAQAGARLANLDQSLYRYRIHPQSLSSTKKAAYQQSAKKLRRDFVKQNSVRCEQALVKLTKSNAAVDALNYRESIYAAILAYRLPFSQKTCNSFLKVFWRASLRLKLHILYTILRA